MTEIDYVLIAIVSLSSIFGLWRGFIREILTMANGTFAIIGTILLFPTSYVFFSTQSEDKMFVIGASTVGVFILITIFMAIVNFLILKIIRPDLFKIIDKPAGFLLGFARGAFIPLLTFTLFSSVMTKDQYPQMLKDSYSLASLEAGAEIFKNLFPGYVDNLEDVIKKQISIE
jgi:membrane protein required for colicin V production